MMPEPDDVISAMTDRDLLEYVAGQLLRLEPLISAFENPPPMLAAMMPGFGIESD